MGVVVVDALPTDPLAALRELALGEEHIQRLRLDRVAAARAAGATWTQVGEALGISRQSAWEHYSAAVRDELAANVSANAALSAGEATDLAVDEVRAVRRSRRSH